MVLEIGFGVSVIPEKTIGSDRIARLWYPTKTKTKNERMDRFARHTVKSVTQDFVMHMLDLKPVAGLNFAQVVLGVHVRFASEKWLWLSRPFWDLVLG